VGHIPSSVFSVEKAVAPHGRRPSLLAAYQSCRSTADNKTNDFKKADPMQASYPRNSARARIPMLAVACALLVAGPAAAADDQGRFAVRGAGSDRCSVFQAAIVANDGARLERYGAWLLGYLSASNRLISRTFDAVPSLAAADLLGLVSVLCRTQPEALVDTVASQALVVLSPIRLTTDSPLLTVSNGGKSLQLRTEALVTLQRNLATKGAFKGPADGKASPQLTKAITEFQQKEKILVSGLPDIDTQIRAGLKK
jgi:hypothetical protein